MSRLDNMLYIGAARDDAATRAREQPGILT
jgi:hypothetical protein